jgi:hypothetical protein
MLAAMQRTISEESPAALGASLASRGTGNWLVDSLSMTAVESSARAHPAAARRKGGAACRSCERDALRVTILEY